MARGSAVSRRLLRPRYRSCAGIGWLRLTSTGGVALARRQGPSLFSRPTSNFQGCFSVTCCVVYVHTVVGLPLRLVSWGGRGGVSKSRGNCWREGEGEGEGWLESLSFSTGSCFVNALMGLAPGRMRYLGLLGCSGKCTERHRQEVPGSGAIHGCRC